MGILRALELVPQGSPKWQYLQRPVDIQERARFVCSDVDFDNGSFASRFDQSVYSK